jgi:hypothetical protein
MKTITWAEIYARHLKTQSAIPFHPQPYWDDAAGMFNMLQGIAAGLAGHLKHHGITWNALNITYDPKVLNAVLSGWEHETIVGPTDQFMASYGIRDATDSVDYEFLNPDLVLHIVYNEGGV